MCYCVLTLYVNGYSDHDIEPSFEEGADYGGYITRYYGLVRLQLFSSPSPQFSPPISVGITYFGTKTVRPTNMFEYRVSM